MPPVVEHRRLLEAQITDYWRACRLAYLQGRLSSAAEAMKKIDLLLERITAAR